MTARSKAEDGMIQAAKKLAAAIDRTPIDVGESAPNMNDYTIFRNVSSKDVDELMKLAKKDRRACRAIGSLVGMAVGDSVGAPLEFLPVGKKGSRFDSRNFKCSGEYNKFDLKPGQWTDDTAMGLCLADSLLVFRNYNGSDIRVRFWNWWNRGYNNAFRMESSRSKSVGLGENIRASLLEIRDSKPPPRFDVEGAEDSGNGSLMRMAPAAVFFHRDIRLTMQVCAEQSFTTHPGPIAADACAFLGFLLASAISRDSTNTNGAREFLDEVVKAYTERPEAAHQPAMMQLLRSSEPVGSMERCWNWRDPAGPYIRETLEARGRSYHGYPVSEGYFGSYSMDGLAIAMHSFYHTKTFLDAISKCVNFLGDADSTGAICGQIAGAYYGFENITHKLYDRIRQWDGGEIALRAAVLYASALDLSEDQVQKAYSSTDGALLDSEERARRKELEDALRKADEASRAADMKEQDRMRKEVADAQKPPIMMDDGMTNAAALAAFGESHGTPRPSRSLPQEAMAASPPTTSPTETPRKAASPKAASPKAALPPTAGSQKADFPKAAPPPKLASPDAAPAPKAMASREALPAATARSRNSSNSTLTQAKADAKSPFSQISFFRPTPLPKLPPVEELPPLPPVVDPPLLPPSSAHPAGLSSISTDIPVLPAGWQVGERVYYCGGKQVFRSGDRLFFALRGKVVGLATPQSDRRLKVDFDDNPNSLDVAMNQLSRTIPTIPGGYKVGDIVYFCGEAQTFFNGDRLAFGMMGEIVGRSTANHADDEKRVKVLLEGNKTAICVFLTQVSKAAPVIPGGLKPGDRIFYCGVKKVVYANGDELKFGMTGEVSGRSTMGDGQDQRRVKVRLDGNKGPVTVLFSEVARPLSEEEKLRSASDEVARLIDLEEERRREDEQLAYLKRIEEDEKRFQEMERQRRMEEQAGEEKRKKEALMRKKVEEHRRQWLAGADAYYKKHEEIQKQMKEEVEKRARAIAEEDAYQKHFAEEEQKKKRQEVETKKGIEQEKKRVDAAKRVKANWLLGLEMNLPDETAFVPTSVPPSSHPLVVSSIARDEVPLPEGWTMDDDLFFTGPVKILDDGSRLGFGTPGKIIGSVTEGYSDGDVHVLAKFNGISSKVEVPVSQIGQEVPSLPKGYQVGDVVYFAGGGQTFPSGNRLEFALSGEVVGPATPPDEQRIKVWFDSNPSPTDVSLPQIMREVPVIPGGYKVGDRVYYHGEHQTFSDGDRLSFALPGEVVGRSTAGQPADDRRLKVAFEGNTLSVSVFLTQVSRQLPTLPGEYCVGDKVVFNAAKRQKFTNGDQLFKGMTGEIIGRSTMGDVSDDKRVKVRFEGNSGSVNVLLTEIDPTPQQRKAMEGRKKKEEVASKERKSAEEARRAKAAADSEKQAAARAADVDSKKVEEPRRKDEERKSAEEARRAKAASDSEKQAAARAADLDSKKVEEPRRKDEDAPTVDAEIPGGYKAGDIVYFNGGRQKLPSGDQLMFALEGKILGLATPPDDRRVSILFTGNVEPMDVIATQVSRNVPVIPGGYFVDDRIFFNGELQTFSNGDKLVFGMQGSVVGRSTFGDGSDDRRVKVMMDGNSGPCTVYLTQVCREPPTLPGKYWPGERVVYTSQKRQTFKNGDRLEKGVLGTVVGRSKMGDQEDTKRIKVKFDCNQGPNNVLIADLALHQGGPEFAVGDRCEALYDDRWYAGKIMALAKDDTEKLGRWAVQCDVDEDGLYTFAADIRREGAGAAVDEK